LIIIRHKRHSLSIEFKRQASKEERSSTCLHVDPADGAVLGEEALEVILAGVVVEVAAEHRPHGLRLSAASFVTAL